MKSFSGNLGWLASLILILAIIAFMQSAPKLLEEVFGYKPSEDSKAISGIAKGALGLGIGAAVGTLGVASQLGKFVSGKVVGNKPPGKFRRGLHKVREVGGAVSGGIQDVFRSGAEGFKTGAKGGVMSARHTPKDLNYKQARQAREKANAERWQKQKEFEVTRDEGKKLMKDLDNFTQKYINDSSHYTGDATYAALKAAASAPGATQANKEAFVDYAKAAKKKEISQAFNEKYFQKIFIQRKTLLLKQNMNYQHYLLIK